MSWRNAIRTVPISQEIIDARKTRCTCPENDNAGEFGDNSNLPCMSFEPDCDLACKDCIYCEVIKDGEVIKDELKLNNMESKVITQISEYQSKLYSEMLAFEEFAKSHEKELVELFKEQYPDVKLISGKIYVDNGLISINGMEYVFSNNKWKKL